jgi:5'-nucleotidase
MRPLILVSNDDGITSQGIRVLIDIMKELGDVLVVAPDSPQSGMGHAITINNTLRLDQTDIHGPIQAYECSGTPADCVKMAKHYILKDRNPDLVVSGINHGSNASINVLYSGTMSAAIEGALEGLPSIGFSLCDYAHIAHMDHIRPFVKHIAKEALEKGIPKGVALNVNFPAYHPDKPIKGIKICRQANASWREEFDERQDPNGRRYFWMTGFFQNHDHAEDTDEYALANDFVSIVPCTFDLTAYHALSGLNKDWDLRREG